MRQICVNHIQFDAFATNRGPVFAAIELECLAGLEHQRYVRPAPSCLLGTMPISTPRARKGCHPLVGVILTKSSYISLALRRIAGARGSSPQRQRKMFCFITDDAWANFELRGAHRRKTRLSDACDFFVENRVLGVCQSTGAGLGWFGGFAALDPSASKPMPLACWRR